MLPVEETTRYMQDGNSHRYNAHNPQLPQGQGSVRSDGSCRYPSGSSDAAPQIVNILTDKVTGRVGCAGFRVAQVASVGATKPVKKSVTRP